MCATPSLRMCDLLPPISQGCCVVEADKLVSIVSTRDAVSRQHGKLRHVHVYRQQSNTIECSKGPEWKEMGSRRQARGCMMLMWCRLNILSVLFC